MTQERGSFFSLYRKLMGTGFWSISAEYLKIGRINLDHGFPFKLSGQVARCILFNLRKLDYKERVAKFITQRMELHSELLANLPHKEKVFKQTKKYIGDLIQLTWSFLKFSLGCLLALFVFFFFLFGGSFGFLARKRPSMKNTHFSGFLTGVIVTEAVLSAVGKWLGQVILGWSQRHLQKMILLLIYLTW